MTTPEHPNTIAYISEALSCTTAHQLHKQLPRARYPRQTFFGVAIDTCCSYSSTGGIEQYHAYCVHAGIGPDIDKSYRTTYTAWCCRWESYWNCEVPLPSWKYVLEYHFELKQVK